MSKLYSTEMLGLAAQLARYPMDAALPLRAQSRSKTCGSTIVLGLGLDEAGTIDAIGLQVSACAVGQSSAALLAAAIKGTTPSEISATKQTIERWLAGEGALPDWPGFSALEPALEHKGRHGALLLPWDAASKAIAIDLSSQTLF